VSTNSQFCEGRLSLAQTFDHADFQEGANHLLWCAWRGPWPVHRFSATILELSRIPNRKLAAPKFMHQKVSRIEPSPVLVACCESRTTDQIALPPPPDVIMPQAWLNSTRPRIPIRTLYIQPTKMLMLNLQDDILGALPVGLQKSQAWTKPRPFNWEPQILPCCVFGPRSSW
jgi:hypothetical protein